MLLGVRGLECFAVAVSSISAVSYVWNDANEARDVIQHGLDNALRRARRQRHARHPPRGCCARSPCDPRHDRAHRHSPDHVVARSSSTGRCHCGRSVPRAPRATTRAPRGRPRSQRTSRSQFVIVLLRLALRPYGIVA
jgi:hypothetical protein